MGQTFRVIVRLGATLLGAVLTAGAQPAITTYHNDLSRSGLNSAETILTPQNVTPASFGKLFSMQIDGPSNAQPLYVPSVNIPGKGVHNVLYVVTEHDSVYAFDADSNVGQNANPLWRATLLDSAHGAPPGATAEPISDLGNCGDVTPEVGIVGTPVIDATSGSIYLVGKTNENGAAVQRLHALDIATGAEKFNGPALIQATVSGTGSGSAGGRLSFDPKWSIQRTGLLLLNGYVYIGFASHCDFSTWHGWMMAYNAMTLQQSSALPMTPNTTGGGVWMSGAAPAGEIVNGVPRLYISTGNGDFDGAPDHANNIVRIDSPNGVMSIADHFTPSNQAALNSADSDVSSGGVLFLPDQGAGGHQRMLVLAAKEGRIYLVDRDNMGQFHTASNNIVQDLPNALTGLWGTPSFWNNNVYFWGCSFQDSATTESMKVFSLSNGRLSSSPVGKSARSSLYPGAVLSISSNATSNAIVWANLAEKYQTLADAVLMAYDANNVGTPLWSSDQNSARDSAGPAVKFSVPTIAGGKVYSGNVSAINVYGLLNSTSAAPVFSPTAGTFSGSVNVTLASANNGASIYYTVDGSNPTTASQFYRGAFNLTSTATVKAIAIVGGTNLSPVVAATYVVNASSGSNQFGITNFAAAPMIVSGSASTGSQLTLTSGQTSQTSAAYYSTKLPVQNFTTNFAFQLQNPRADGLMFVIQNAGPTAMGAGGGGLGFSGMGRSVGIKFDLYNNSGETPTSTGLYLNGASPTTPSQDLGVLGIDLHSGHIMNVSLNYNGTTLTMVLADQFTSRTANLSWTVDIPTIVGGASAYVGFTAATGGLTSIALVNSWNYSSTATSNSDFGLVAAPATIALSVGQSAATLISVSPLNGFNGTVTFSVSGLPAGVTASFSQASSAQSSTMTLTAAANATPVNATVTVTGTSGSLVHTAMLPVSVSPASGGNINLGSLILNGSAAAGVQLTLTSGQNNQTGAAYAPAKLNVQSFTSNFTFQLQNAQADGMMFVIQNSGPTAMGVGGGGLGFSGMNSSVGIKFDLYNNTGETPSSTGLYLYGASPTTPSQDLGALGIDLHSGHPMNATVSYDGTTLTLVLADQVTSKSATLSWSVDIPGTVGGTTAYVGFTAATGGLTTTAIVNSWSYSSGTKSSGGGTATSVVPGAPQCASENSACSVPAGSTASVYYGAGSSFLIQNGVTGSIGCNNQAFGTDPAPGVVKGCYVVVTALPLSAKSCAVENGTCSIPAGTTATMFFGANGVNIYRTGVTGSLVCSTAAFAGDPIFGVFKSCAWN